MTAPPLDDLMHGLELLRRAAEDAPRAARDEATQVLDSDELVKRVTAILNERWKRDYRKTIVAVGVLFAFVLTGALLLLSSLGQIQTKNASQDQAIQRSQIVLIGFQAQLDEANKQLIAKGLPPVEAPRNPVPGTAEDAQLRTAAATATTLARVTEVGRTPDAQKVASAVADYMRANTSTPPDPGLVIEQVAAYLAVNPVTPGPPGPAGATGSAGAAGSAGTAGTNGDPGAAGAQGAPGSAGIAGEAGAAGTAGSAGAAGTAGADGQNGAPGEAGAQGPQGDPGTAPSVEDIRSAFRDDISSNPNLLCVLGGSYGSRDLALADGGHVTQFGCFGSDHSGGGQDQNPPTDAPGGGSSGGGGGNSSAPEPSLTPDNPAPDSQQPDSTPAKTDSAPDTTASPSSAQNLLGGFLGVI